MEGSTGLALLNSDKGLLRQEAIYTANDTSTSKLTKEKSKIDQKKQKHHTLPPSFKVQRKPYFPPKYKLAEKKIENVSPHWVNGSRMEMIKSIDNLPVNEQEMTSKVVQKTQEYRTTRNKKTNSKPETKQNLYTPPIFFKPITQVTKRPVEEPDILVSVNCKTPPSLQPWSKNKQLVRKKSTSKKVPKVSNSFRSLDEFLEHENNQKEEENWKFQTETENNGEESEIESRFEGDKLKHQKSGIESKEKFRMNGTRTKYQAKRQVHLLAKLQAQSSTYKSDTKKEVQATSPYNAKKQNQLVMEEALYPPVSHSEKSPVLPPCPMQEFPTKTLKQQSSGLNPPQRVEQFSSQQSQGGLNVTSQSKLLHQQFQGEYQGHQAYNQERQLNQNSFRQFRSQNSQAGKSSQSALPDKLKNPYEKIKDVIQQKASNLKLKPSHQSKATQGRPKSQAVRPIKKTPLYLKSRKPSAGVHRKQKEINLKHQPLEETVVQTQTQKSYSEPQLKNQQPLQTKLQQMLAQRALQQQLQPQQSKSQQPKLNQSQLQQPQQPHLRNSQSRQPQLSMTQQLAQQQSMTQHSVQQQSMPQQSTPPQSIAQQVAPHQLVATKQLTPPQLLPQKQQSQNQLQSESKIEPKSQLQPQYQSPPQNIFQPDLKQDRIDAQKIHDKPLSKKITTQQHSNDQQKKLAKSTTLQQLQANANKGPQRNWAINAQAALKPDSEKSDKSKSNDAAPESEENKENEPKMNAAKNQRSKSSFKFTIKPKPSIVKPNVASKASSAKKSRPGKSSLKFSPKYKYRIQPSANAQTIIPKLEENEACDSTKDSSSHLQQNDVQSPWSLIEPDIPFFNSDMINQVNTDDEDKNLVGIGKADGTKLKQETSSTSLSKNVIPKAKAHRRLLGSFADKLKAEERKQADLKNRSKSHQLLTGLPKTLASSSVFPNLGISSDNKFSDIIENETPPDTLEASFKNLFTLQKDINMQYCFTS